MENGLKTTEISQHEAKSSKQDGEEEARLAPGGQPVIRENNGEHDDLW